MQDYSYEYGRGVSRFEEAKVKQAKKDLGPHVYLYADRCIMCTRCVRFTREVTGTSELLVQGRGNREEIDVFPGRPLDNELSANVIDLCPVGALLDKDFLFTQRVWFLKETPSIDGITASGDNIRIDHNDGKVYRVKPRLNMAANRWWISDEVRYGWKHVHDPARVTLPRRAGKNGYENVEWSTLPAELDARLSASNRVAAVLSPHLTVEEAYQLAKYIRGIDEQALLVLGPIPIEGEDERFPNGFTIRAEKCPNRRGVEEVIVGIAKELVTWSDFLVRMSDESFDAVWVTGGYKTSRNDESRSATS